MTRPGIVLPTSRTLSGRSTDVATEAVQGSPSTAKFHFVPRKVENWKLFVPRLSLSDRERVKQLERGTAVTVDFGCHVSTIYQH